MPQRSPSITELVEAVRSFIEEQATPHLEGRVAFHAKVAANALGIVQRELEARADESRTQLRALLGFEGDGEDLERELCRRLRAGEMGLETPGVSDYLWRETLDRLAVDQPTYASYRRALRAPLPDRGDSE